MLNGAKVLMILAGIFGLPAVGCSGACAAVGAGMGASQDPLASSGQAIMETLAWLALMASIGSIIVGSTVKRLGKVISGVSALLFGGIFAILLIQMNVLGLLSALMLLIAGIMILVAPSEMFRNVQRVEVVGETSQTME